MVIVTFKDNRKKLVCFFNAIYADVVTAKQHMVEDAYCYSDKHGGMPKWVDPDCADYLEVEGDDGCNCIWQYCQI